MAELSDSEKRRIVDALKERGAEGPCPRCGTREFTLVGGYFNPPVQTELSGFQIGGPSIPCAVIVCNKCGWLAQHALGVLGLLPTPKEKEGEK